MLIKVRFMSDQAQARPLVACIERAAREMGMTEFAVAELMSHFLEELCTQACRNRVVLVPGLGKFGQRGYWPSDPELRAYCFPAFVPARSFRRMVAFRLSRAQGSFDAVRRHRRHHHPSSRPEKCSSRPFMAFRVFRRHMGEQARRLGYAPSLHWR